VVAQHGVPKFLIDVLNAGSYTIHTNEVAAYFSLVIDTTRALRDSQHKSCLKQGVIAPDFGKVLRLSLHQGFDFPLT
jgi:hypothetical protein